MCSNIQNQEQSRNYSQKLNGNCGKIYQGGLKIFSDRWCQWHTVTWYSKKNNAYFTFIFVELNFNQYKDINNWTKYCQCSDRIVHFFLYWSVWQCSTTNIVWMAVASWHEMKNKLSNKTIDGTTEVYKKANEIIILTRWVKFLITNM